MLLHGVLRLVVLLGGLLDFGFQYTHLGRRHVALFHQWVGDGLQQQGDEYQHNAHVQTELRKPVEHVEREIAVDIADERPTQIDEALHLQVFAEGALLLDALQQTEVVGAIVELKLRGLQSRRVERRLQLGAVLLQVVRFLLLRHRGHQGILGKVVLSYHHCREILIFEGYPVDGFLHCFVLLTLRLIEVICTTVGEMIGQRRTLVLEREAFLLLAATFVPLDIHLLIGGWEQSVHTLGGHRHVQQVVFAERVVHDQLFAGSSHCCHRHGGVRLVRWGEYKFLRDDVHILTGQKEVQLLVFLVEEGDVRVALMVLEPFHYGFCDGSTFGGERQFQLLVL